MEERLQIEQILAEEARNIGEMEEEQLDEEGLVKEMGSDLRRLFEEGDQGSDERSERICL